MSQYDYRDEGGDLLYQVVRYSPKDFRPRSPNGSGGWIHRRGKRRVPYRLPELLAADPRDMVFITEGEKDADALAAQGLVATCNDGGAGKWPASFAKYLTERRVAILADNDEAGRNHARKVRDSLRSAGICAEVLELPGLPPKGDVSDWLDNGGDPEVLINMAEVVLGSFAPALRPVPFALRPVHQIPPREWLYGRHLIRGFLSLTVAPGGLGKSSLLIAEALAMVTGRALFGVTPRLPLKVWIWNGEDPLDELERRIAAACLHHHISADQIGDRLSVTSGRDLPITLVSMGKDGPVVNERVRQRLVAAIIDAGVDVLIVDPFVTTHQVPENDTTAMNAVVAAWRSIAAETGCAIELVHHVSKAGAMNGEAMGVYGSRGAGAVIDAVRSARYLVRMQPEEADKFGVLERERFFRIHNGKANLAPSDDATWREMVGVPLGNGTPAYPEGDIIGVCVLWAPPDAFDDVSVRDLQRVQQAIEASESPPRENERAEDWVGYLIAETLGLDVGRARSKAERNQQQAASRAKVKQLLKTWLRNGALVATKRQSERHGREVGFVFVGEPVTEADIRGVTFNLKSALRAAEPAE